MDVCVYLTLYKYKVCFYNLFTFLRYFILTCCYNVAIVSF